MNKQTLGALLVAAVALVPLASASPETAVPPPETVCDLVESSQSAWTQPAPGVYATTFDLKQVNCHALFVQGGGPGESGTISTNISCSAVVHTDTKTTHTGWWLVIWWTDEVETKTTVTSDLSCDGTYTVTINHFGGLGPRTVTDSLTGSRLGGVDAGSTAGQPSGCKYFDPLVSSCTTTSAGDASRKETGIGGIIKSVTPCASYAWADQSDLAVLGGASGNDQVCGARVPVSASDLSALV